MFNRLEINTKTCSFSLKIKIYKWIAIKKKNNHRKLFSAHVLINRNSPTASLNPFLITAFQNKSSFQGSHQSPPPHLPQQFEHFSRLLRLLLPEKPLDLPDPRHPPHIWAVVGFPQHPWQLVGLEHQGGKQEVSAATSLALPRAVIPLASPLGQLAVEIETPLSGQLRAHHSWEGASVIVVIVVVEEVVVVREISQHAAKTSHLTCSQMSRDTPAPSVQNSVLKKKKFQHSIIFIFIIIITTTTRVRARLPSVPPCSHPSTRTAWAEHSGILLASLGAWCASLSQSDRGSPHSPESESQGGKRKKQTNKKKTLSAAWISHFDPRITARRLFMWHRVNQGK